MSASPFAADEPMAELHAHLGGSVPTYVMWESAHAQGIHLPTRDYWEFDRMVSISDPRGVDGLDALDKVYHYFPRLKERRGSQAGYTSGGEQQMCAIGRSLMAQPSMILLDEPSMGLAPQIVEEIFEIVKDLNRKENVSFLLAEQNTTVALRYADFGYILENGRVVMEGEAAALASNEDVKEFYLGVSGAGRKSFRDMKFYRRRKRWLA